MLNDLSGRSCHIVPNYQVLKEIWRGLIFCLTKSALGLSINEQALLILQAERDHFRNIKYHLYVKKKDRFPLHTYTFELTDRVQRPHQNQF